MLARAAAKDDTNAQFLCHSFNFPTTSVCRCRALEFWRQVKPAAVSGLVSRFFPAPTRTIHETSRRKPVPLRVVSWIVLAEAQPTFKLRHHRPSVPVDKLKF